ncbi:ABC transporter permease [Neobacillus niacini]|uniref:ABC transporter permease n=1 Tax=Neobacillus niacini TaxID=86668 RepID=UPI0021CAEC6A|nr:ABC transporter permease [Neobacillus niacini]MCM3767371.1 ABC transporter permease [Neobacillus niacini]
MFDDKKLWRDRASARMKDLGRYLRYIFNGHLVIVLLFLIGTGAFYYQQWVQTLPADFPAELIIAVFVGLFLTYSPVYNFLFEADKVFIIPLEERLKGYFWRSGVVSFVFQGYILLMVLAVFMPMYAKVNNTGFSLFFPFLLVLLAVKAWNLAASWQMDYYVQPSVRRSDMAVRYFMNVTFAYLLLEQANWPILLVIGFLMAFYFWYFYSRTRKMGLKWDLLIDQEEKRMASFYRLANLFTDVPKLKDSVNRRKWLDVFVRSIPFAQEKTYLYLFTRTFLRASDYLGLFIRLAVIGVLGIYFISFGLGQILLGVLFLYLTGFQLLPLWKHHQNKLWVDLYPVAEASKQKDFQFLLMVIMSIETIIFATVIGIKGEVVLALFELLAGLLFSYVFVYFYSKKRIQA